MLVVLQQCPLKLTLIDQQCWTMAIECIAIADQQSSGMDLQLIATKPSVILFQTKIIRAHSSVALYAIYIEHRIIVERSSVEYWLLCKQ